MPIFTNSDKYTYTTQVWFFTSVSALVFLQHALQPKRFFTIRALMRFFSRVNRRVISQTSPGCKLFTANRAFVSLFFTRMPTFIMSLKSFILEIQKEAYYLICST